MRESRIQSEKTRRVVIAIIMGGVLAASTGWAVLLSGGMQGRGAVELVEERVEGFTFGRPGAWERRELRPDGDLVQGNGVEFAGDHGRKLIVLEMKYERPTPPGIALREFIPQVASRSVEADMTGPLDRVGPFSVAGGLVYDNGRMSLIAAMTVDGRRHLLISLTRPGDFHPLDQDLLDAVTRSVRDTRFVALGERLTLPVGLSIEVPGNLKALGVPGDEALNHVLFYPATNPMFFVLSIEPIDLTAKPMPDAQAGPVTPGVIEERALPAGVTELLNKYETLGPADRLVTRLVLEYRRVTGSAPSRERFHQFVIADDGQTGFQLVLTDPRRHAAFEAMLGVTLDERQAALMHLAAEPRAYRPVQQAAEVVAQTLTGARHAPALPMNPVQENKRDADNDSQEID